MSIRSLNWLKFGGLVALAFALGLLFAGLLDLPHRSLAQTQASSGAPAVIAPVQAPSIPEARPLVDLSEAFAAIADAVRPSVVYVRSERSQTAEQRRVPPGMERFFPRGVPQGPGLERGTGSGFIVSEDGYLLTNNHVVEGADKVIVRLLDRREFTAKVVGSDPNTDVAVLKIDAEGLRPLALGDSDAADIGEWVLAVGNPLGEGLTFTVTQGIISAKGRPLEGLNPSSLNISDFIQTDAAINPGNSGGPLVNVRGEVIGINSAIASETGRYEGYGFAIPVNLARNVMEQLISTGRVQRAALGINIRPANVNDAAYVGLPAPTGVLIVDLSDDSPARKAGLLPGDVIIAVDGRTIEYTGQLQQEIGFRAPGEEVAVTVARKGGERKTFDVTLQSLEAAAQVASGPGRRAPTEPAEAPAPAGPSVIGDRLGVTVETVTPTIARELQLGEERGLIVTEVTPGGPSYERLLDPRQGGPDVILSVEGKPVRTDADLRAVLQAQKPGDVVTLRVYNPRFDNRRVERVRLGGD
jgi:serine protease Do